MILMNIIIEKNKQSTVFQNDNCRKNIKINDIILLYFHKVGYIKYGYFTGKIYLNGINHKDKLPNWNIIELSDGYCIYEWFNIKKPYKIKNPLRKTHIINYLNLQK